MSLADEFNAVVPRPAREYVCITCKWLESQPEDVRAALFAARDRGVIMKDLHAVAARNGLPVLVRTFTDCMKGHHARG